MFEEHDVVKLLKPLKITWDGEEIQLSPGMTGTVLGVDKQKNVYLVDFGNDDGDTLAMTGVKAPYLELVWESKTKSYVHSKRKTAM